MKQQPTYYAIIPAKVRYSKQLKDRQKLLYAEITALANKSGYCYASNATIASYYNCEPETISRDISTLKKYGFIRVEIDKSEGNVRRIYPLMDIYGIDHSVIPIDHTINTPIDHTIKHNNTSNNSIDIETRIIKYFIEKVNGAYEAIPGPETKNNITAILRTKTTEQLKKVIDKKAAQFHAGEIDARIFNMKWLLRPDNFFTQLSIIENPASKQQTANGKNSGKLKGAKVNDKFTPENTEKWKQGWQ